MSHHHYKPLTWYERLAIVIVIVLGALIAVVYFAGCTSQNDTFAGAGSGADMAELPRAVGDADAMVDAGPSRSDALPLADDGGDGGGVVAVDAGPDLVQLADMRPACAGYVSPEIGGCWYVTSDSCTNVCEPHGGFDAVASKHVGDPILTHFYPKAGRGGQRVAVEVLMGDTIYGANGNEVHPDITWALPVACACRG